MTITNISRAEAATRAREVSVASYQVSLDLTEGPNTFRSTTRVLFASIAAQSWIDLIAPELLSVQLNGQALDIANYDGARIQLENLTETNELIVEANCAYMNSGEGLHRFVDPVDEEVYLYTQFETADARRMYACFEQPDLKATFQLTVSAPAHWQVISNAATPEPLTVADAATWRFEPTPVMSTYITALVAGPYASFRDSYEGLGGTYPLGIFCRQSLAEFMDADEIFQITKQGFAFFEGVFDLAYPFGKYDQLFVPEFNAGAMENAGCVTFLEDYVFRSRVTAAAYEQRANTILHEMAHMWFGDLVTMKWWDDLWLNESFAEWASHYASVNATKFTEAWTSFAIQRKAWAYRQDQLPSTHPIAANMTDLDAVRVNFDGITYAKGASALKQLVAWVGEEEFLTGLRAYFKEFAWQNTELPDLLRHLEAASGRDLSDWTRQWLQTSGVNLLRAEVSTDGDTMTSVVIEQEPPAMPAGLEPILRDHRLGIGLYDRKGDSLELRERLAVDIKGARTAVPALAGKTQPDLLLLNDEDLTFAKIRLDDRSKQTVISAIDEIQDSLARTLIWGAAWDMTRDGEMSTGDYVSLVSAGLATEADVAVVQTILRQVHAAVDQYAAPQNRNRYASALADNLWAWARAADPGSDHQLAFVRGLAAMAQTPKQLQIVADLLSGDEELAGLKVDTDLRWGLLQSLAAAGMADAARIEAEAEADPTATGRRHRAMALASLPTAEAKADAWAAIMGGELPNALLDATLGGFSRAGQAEILAPYIPQYFAQLPKIWQDRTPEMAQSITMLLYPYLAVSEATAQAAETFAAGDAEHPAAVRLVGEGADSTRRALRARAVDAG